jgi:hypothetical protein
LAIPPIATLAVSNQTYPDPVALTPDVTAFVLNSTLEEAPLEDRSNLRTVDPEKETVLVLLGRAPSEL